MLQPVDDVVGSSRNIRKFIVQYEAASVAVGNLSPVFFSNHVFTVGAPSGVPRPFVFPISMGNSRYRLSCCSGIFV